MSLVAVFCKTRSLLDSVKGEHEYHVANGAGKCNAAWADPKAEFAIAEAITDGPEDEEEEEYDDDEE